MWAEWIAVPLSILGNILVARKRIEGFVIWIISNIFWVYVGVKSKLWGMAALFIAYSLINLYAILFWKRKKGKKTK